MKISYKDRQYLKRVLSWEISKLERAITHCKSSKDIFGETKTPSPTDDPHVLKMENQIATANRITAILFPSTQPTAKPEDKGEE
jgi:hypothetical protein